MLHGAWLTAMSQYVSINTCFCTIYRFFNSTINVYRAYQRGGGGGGGQKGQFAPDSRVKWAPKFGKIKFGTFFDINNGLRKDFLNLNFADIGPKKGFKLARYSYHKNPAQFYAIYIIYYTLYIIHYTLYIIHYTSHIIHYTLYIIHYTLYIIHYTLYIIHYTLYIIHYTLYIIHYTFIIYRPGARGIRRNITRSDDISRGALPRGKYQH